MQDKFYVWTHIKYWLWIYRIYIVCILIYISKYIHTYIVHIEKIHIWFLSTDRNSLGSALRSFWGWWWRSHMGYQLLIWFDYIQGKYSTCFAIILTLKLILLWINIFYKYLHNLPTYFYSMHTLECITVILRSKWNCASKLVHLIMFS